MNSPHNKFEYTYAAPTESERKTIERIRKNYLPQEKHESDLDRLKALDGKVQNPPMAFALSFGVVGTLVFGLGLTLILEFGKLFFGAVLSVVGVVPVALAYPVYRFVLKAQKKKYAAEILALSEKLLQNGKN